MTRTKNKSRGLYRCKGCGKEFQTDSALFDHLIARTKRCLNTACFYCDYDERSPVHLPDHMQKRHSVFECAFCPEKFFLRTKFEEHMKKQEGVDVTSWSGDSLIGLDDTESLIESLNPDDVVYEECHRIKGKLEWFMHHNTSYKRCHITMSGSIAKETPLRKADVDLILFLHECTALEEFIDIKEEIIDRMKRHVENRDMTWAHGLRFQRSTPYSIQFELSVGGSSTLMDVDLLPAMQLLRSNNCSERDALYTKMKTMSEKERRHYSPCLSELQVQFVKKVPDTLKQVIRIVKNWIKIVREDEKCSTVRCYFCELVVIDYWMNEGSPHHGIDVGDYVRQVLYRLCFCQSVRIFWPDEYDFFKYRNEVDQPMVLDPANPFVNVAPNMKDASRVSKRAMKMFESYGTVRPKQSAFKFDYSRSPATLQRPADMSIQIDDVEFNEFFAGSIVLPSVKYIASKPTSQQPAKCSCSWKCKCVLVFLAILVAIVLGVIIWLTV